MSMKKHKTRQIDMKAIGALLDINGEAYLKGTYWKQRRDTEDPRFTIIEMRLGNGGMMPDTEYKANDAFDRIKRFCMGYIAGVREGRGEKTS